MHGWGVLRGLTSARSSGSPRAAVGMLMAVVMLIGLTALALGPPQAPVPRSTPAAPVGMSFGTHPAVFASDDPRLRPVAVSFQASALVGSGAAGASERPPLAVTGPLRSQNIAVDFGESSSPPSLAGSSRAGGSGLVLTAALEPGVTEPGLMNGPTRTAYLGRLTRIFSRPPVRPG